MLLVAPTTVLSLSFQLTKHVASLGVAMKVFETAPLLATLAVAVDGLAAVMAQAGTTSTDQLQDVESYPSEIIAKALLNPRKLAVGLKVARLAFEAGVESTNSGPIAAP